MTQERINEIFRGVQELREWCESEGKNKRFIAARGNGKTARAFRFVETIDIICAALSVSEDCYNCANYNTRLCAECVRGCTTNYYTPRAGECEKCGKPGLLGKNLVLHNDNLEKETVLCRECHISEHRMEGKK